MNVELTSYTISTQRNVFNYAISFTKKKLKQYLRKKLVKHTYSNCYTYPHVLAMHKREFLKYRKKSSVVIGQMQKF